MSFIAGRDSFRILRIGMGGCSSRRSTLQEGGRVVRSPAIRMKAIPKRNRSPEKISEVLQYADFEFANLMCLHSVIAVRSG